MKFILSFFEEIMPDRTFINMLVIKAPVVKARATSGVFKTFSSDHTNARLASVVIITTRRFDNTLEQVYED